LSGRANKPSRSEEDKTVRRGMSTPHEGTDKESRG